MRRIQMSARTDIDPDDLHLALAQAGVPVVGLEIRGKNMVVVLPSAETMAAKEVAAAVARATKPTRDDKAEPMSEQEQKLAEVLREIAVLEKEPEIYAQRLGKLGALRATIKADILGR